MKNSQGGFIAADFLFSFTLVISIGIIIFAFTFSLATIEISQYIVWSAARNYSAAYTNEAEASANARKKFNFLSAQFPLLTGVGASDKSWFTLDDFTAGDLAKNSNFTSKITNNADLQNADGANEKRQPWIGATAKLSLNLFTSIQIPFLGKLVDDPEKFKFRIYAFILRHPSISECQKFYDQRFEEGIQKMESFSSIGEATSYVRQEDNGC